jgi:prolyl-tRNA synthetase
MTVAEDLYDSLGDRGIDLLLDDRDERAGVKFKDADLIGIPIQIVIGERNLKEGLIELSVRRTREKTLVKIDDAVDHIVSVVASNE